MLVGITDGRRIHGIGAPFRILLVFRSDQKFEVCLLRMFWLEMIIIFRYALQFGFSNKPEKVAPVYIWNLIWKCSCVGIYVFITFPS